jgi:hypothetical protein
MWLEIKSKTTRMAAKERREHKRKTGNGKGRSATESKIRIKKDVVSS